MAYFSKNITVPACYFIIQGDPTYPSPMVVGPTLKELEDISSELNLGLEGSNELEEYQSVINDSLEMVNQLDDVVEPCLLVEYPRTPGYRPTKDENPHNAWCYKSTIRGAESGKLSGKRIAIKDCIAVAGLPMMVGFNGLEGYVPDFDATVVRWVLAEGGVIPGKATCEELCNSANSHTSGTGPVTNPINPRHCSGGSSSGCAVLVATNEVDMAIGSDQGGSIRIPAAWCGLVGLKPTYGLIPFTGAGSREYGVDHLGPITRTVKDCALLLEVLSGYDDGNDSRQPRDLKTPSYSDQLEGLDMTSIRIAILKEGFDLQESDPEVDRLVRDRIDEFVSSTGVQLQEVSIPLHKSGVAIGKVIGDIGGMDTIFKTAGVGLNHTGYYATSMMKEVGTRLKHNAKDFHPINKEQLMTGIYLKENYCHLYGKAQNLRRQLEKDFEDVFANNDVVVMPTVPFTAPPMLESNASISESIRFALNMTANLKTGNLTGHPSITINAGGLGGLPVGVMLTGKKFNEVQLLQIAHAFEKFIKCREEK